MKNKMGQLHINLVYIVLNLESKLLHSGVFTLCGSHRVTWYSHVI
jgi:hypothetical protein